jgi:glycosyltransferase involved in cell wall biosynthesis
MSTKVKISGVTIVRNALLLEYPLRESVLSVLPLCDEFVIVCGDSTDGTRELCENLQKESAGKIRIIDSVWEKNNQAGGFQLKAQTDIGIRAAKGDWCFVIQADEVIHEEDYANIKEAIQKADGRADVDGILFDYVHFYASHHYEIRGRNWYRREVRAFKSNRAIEAFRDAQGFRKHGQRLKVISANARIFHYGYVRSPESLKKKSTEMARWWGQNPSPTSQSFTLHRHVGLSRYRLTHPAIMAERIAQYGDTFRPQNYSRKWDKREIKNALTLLWESIFPFRLGEFRNYDLG